MKSSARLFLIIIFAVSIAICACVTGGDVVRVTTVENSKLNGIREGDLEKLKEIKKSRKNQDIDNNLSNVIEATQHFTVSEYLMQHPEMKGASEVDYRVGGYDVLSITIYEEKDLSREAVRVTGKGYISFPLIGRIKVDNLTCSQIERLISHKLAEQQYLLDAHISVMVTEYNSKHFLVLGAVKNPGSYSLRAQECVLDGISKAQGIDSDEAGKKAMIIRTKNHNLPRKNKIVIDFDLQGLLKGRDQISNIFLADKDVIYIPMAEHFYIIGQINNPGSYTLTNKEITLLEAIGMAGGFTSIAARNKTRVIRVEDGVEKIIQVKMDAIMDAGKKIKDVLIKPNDVIVVPESFF